jgi:hypothetical protein
LGSGSSFSPFANLGHVSAGAKIPIMPVENSPTP